MSAKIEYVAHGESPRPGGHYSPAVICGDMVYVSGQLPVAKDGSHNPSAIFEAQAETALANLQAVLAEAGCNLHDMVKVTAYIVGIENWPLFNGVYSKLLGDHKPARSVVPVPELHFGYLVEIDAVALRRN
jgi:reactive intermediate/imine deaminase